MACHPAVGPPPRPANTLPAALLPCSWLLFYLNHHACSRCCRVPLADATLAHAPAELSDEEALLLGDIFSTGFFCADNAGIPALAAAAAAAAHSEGPVVAVVGCGPVGLLAIIGEPWGFGAGGLSWETPQVHEMHSVPDWLNCLPLQAAS